MFLKIPYTIFLVHFACGCDRSEQSTCANCASCSSRLTVEVLPCDRIAVKFFEPEDRHRFPLLPYPGFPNKPRHPQQFFAIQFSISTL